MKSTGRVGLSCVAIHLGQFLCRLIRLCLTVLAVSNFNSTSLQLQVSLVYGTGRATSTLKNIIPVPISISESLTNVESPGRATTRFLGVYRLTRSTRS